MNWMKLSPRLVEPTQETQWNIAPAIGIANALEKSQFGFGSQASQTPLCVASDVDGIPSGKSSP